MSRAHRMGIGLVALALVTSGCFGPFNLTRRLYKWNEQVVGKWELEFMFILLAWAPVYGVTILGDAVVFNSMEFWTGKNPVDPPSAQRSALPQTKRLVRGDDEARLTYTATADGPHLVIEQFRQGQPAGSLRVEQRDGKTVGLDAAGRVLLTAETLADGRVVVRDRTGQPVRPRSIVHSD